MLFRLDELQPGKTIAKTFESARAELETALGKLVITGITAHLKFRLDPLGYVVHYEAQAKVEAPCVRCGQPVTTQVKATDWVSLRTRQPEEGHLILDKSEMNVRFIADSEFDVEEFILETIELATPDFPRHEALNPACQVDEEPNVAEDSPFSSLARLLK